MSHPTDVDELKTDEHDVHVHDVETEAPGLEDGLEVDQAYLNSSRWTRFFRGTLFQMFLFGALSFCGPAMSDAISGMGGGGLETPYTANIANAISYGMSCAMTLFGGPLVNKLGIKWACVIAGTLFPLDGSAYYVNSKYGTQWYLIFDAVVGGIGGGFLYVAEATAMLSYPKPEERGKYLSIWVSMRNSGQIIGGIVDLANNIGRATAGAVAVSTYLIFVAFECLGLPTALVLSPTSKVRRSDGTRVPSSADQSWAAEFVALAKHLKSKRSLLMVIPAFYSFFYGGVFTTYLSLHFSTRSRALSAFITPVGTIVLVSIYGHVIDNKRWTQKKRAWVGLAFWAVPQACVFIWMGIIYHLYTTGSLMSTDIDFYNNSNVWAKTYLPYWIMQCFGYACQLYMYWILACFTTDVKASARTGGLFRCFETLGQSISYAINSHNGNKTIQLYINIGVFVVMLVPMSILIRMVPDEAAAIDDVVNDVAEVPPAMKAQVALAHEPTAL
ncbi:hypothetical protein Q5752_005854 [Cryptotrichosporon argae]